ncbi:hypothetical protein EVAR_71536_1 [Eumeta japonica]|uniref:Uncharacterized protein n=1 Tax=Eumeta variegata TaxID=151549 RepID=A0A4C1T4E9_EUMVA|nr:hypothetical protein EVAR_71536_1 [Eumeta japonica]
MRIVYAKTEVEMDRDICCGKKKKVDQTNNEDMKAVNEESEPAWEFHICRLTKKKKVLMLILWQRDWYALFHTILSTLASDLCSATSEFAVAT